MIPKDWLEIAQLVSSVAAASGLCLTAWQMHRNRQAADLQALQKFFEIASKHEFDLMNKKGVDAWTFSFNEFLNFLEVHCSAYNRGQFGVGCRDMVRHKLEDCYIELELSQAAHSKVGQAKDRLTTFEELLTFSQHHKKEIEKRKLGRARLAEINAAASGG